MDVKTMPDLEAPDNAVVEKWKDVWKNTPFQTLKYFARLHGTAEQAALYQNLPGGNCFDFARAFIQGNTTITNPRIVTYKITSPKFMSHGLASVVNNEHSDRAYNCDSGFFKLIRMPPRTEALHYVKGADQGPRREGGAPPVDKNGLNKSTQYRCEYQHSEWRTDFYPLKASGLVAMGAIQADAADAMAYENASKQSATLYLPRLMSAEGNPSWGDYIALYFGDSSDGKILRGSVVFTWANPSQTEDGQTTLRLNVDAQYALLPDTLARLFGKYAAAGVFETAQWSQAMEDCLQMLLNMLAALVRT